jgi:S1-C subfamily serine protease
MNAYPTRIFVLLFLFLAIRGGSEQTIEAIQRAKQASALVNVEELDRIAEGSSFCIDSSGLFITNAHVVSGLKPGGKLMLVLNPGEGDQVKLPATIVKMDKVMDLAALQIAHPRGLVPLLLGDISRLIETTSVVAFGYPFGTDLALKEGDFPNITVSTGHITSLRKLNGRLAAIQLDASLNEGNSGGPIIDSNGQVIGIVAAGIPGSGINLAIPVTDLRTFLSSIIGKISPF